MKKNIGIIFGAVLLLTLAIFTVVSAFPGPLPQFPPLRDSEAGATDIWPINLGPNQPTDPPGLGTQIIPKFSAVNTPVITNSNDPGPVRVGDDLMVDGLINAKQGITTGPANRDDPTFLYGDLTIQDKGNGTGNLFVDNNIFVPGKLLGGLKFGDMPFFEKGLASLANSTFHKDLQVIGKGVFEDDLIMSNGGIIMRIGDIDVQLGQVKAKKIGAYYRLAKEGAWVGADRTDVTLVCGTGDIMVSCQGHAGVSLNPKMQYLGNYFNAAPSSCYASYLNTTGNQQQTWTQAVCFNPDGGPPADYEGALTQY